MQLLTLLGVSGWFTLLVLSLIAPLLLTQFVAVLFLPAMLGARDARPEDIGRAVYAYLLLAFSTLLIVAGAIPLLTSLLSLQRLPIAGYGTLAVLIFGGGAVILTLSKRLCREIDARAAAVPRAIYCSAFSFLGAVLCILGVLAFLIGGLSTLGAETAYQPLGFWVMPMALFLTGSGILVAFRFVLEGQFKSLCK